LGGCRKKTKKKKGGEFGRERITRTGGKSNTGGGYPDMHSDRKCKNDLAKDRGQKRRKGAETSDREIKGAKGANSQKKGLNEAGTITRLASLKENTGRPRAGRRKKRQSEGGNVGGKGDSEKTNARGFEI